MASKQAVVPYNDMMRVLGIQDIRQLEDKVIDCIYNDLLKGRLNQKNKTLHVASTYGRDVESSAVDDIVAKLQAWDSRLAGAQAFMEQQMQQCTENVHLNYTKQVENEVKYQRELQRAMINLTKQANAIADSEHAFQ